MQYKILASDYDNTLMPFGEAKPRPAVVKAVKKLQAAGGKFVLSTGRSYPGIRDKNQLGGIRYDYAIPMPTPSWMFRKIIFLKCSAQAASPMTERLASFSTMTGT